MMNEIWRLLRARGGRVILGSLLVAVVVVSGSAPHVASAGHAPVAATPPLATAVPGAPLTGLTVPAVERQLLSVVSEVTAAPLPAAERVSLLTQLARLGAQLEGAEGLQRQLDNQNAALDVLLQAKVDVLVAIDKIAADLQINLDQLQLNLDANVNANVDASVGGITLTVTARTEQIKADLNADADRLLVDITADVNLLKIVTLHTTAHVDPQRLAISLHALVTKLRLDLSAVLTDLRVLARASVKAALAVEARLRARITAQVSGVRAQVMAGIDGRIHLQLSSIAALAGLLNNILSSISNQLLAIQSSA